MRMIAVPVSSRSVRMRSRICAWIVTSSAVVGSSAISSFGSQRERHRDHHALAHAAREPVRIIVDSARSGDGMRTRRSISSARSCRLARA